PYQRHANAKKGIQTASNVPSANRRQRLRTLVYRLHDQRRIRAAKAEAVVEYRTDGPFLGLVRHQVDTFGALARVVEVERRRDDLVAHREGAEDALYRACAAQTGG